MGAFTDCLAETETLIAKISDLLNQLEPLIVTSNACNGTLSWDDICLFPILRNLTCVKGLIFPTKIKAYLESMSELSKVNLFFDQAV